jgi:uncharacterized protein (TIGR04255 family)
VISVIEGPDIPAAEYERFASPPLKAMLGQVRFPPVLKVADPGTLAAFQDSVRGRFTEYAEEQQFQVAFAPGQPVQAATAVTHRFSTADGNWSVLLAPDALTVEATAGGRYTSYDEFKELFALAWEAAARQLAPARVVRQGLRYIDHLDADLPNPEWAEWINPELLGPLTGATLSRGLEHALTEMRFRRPDGLLVFRHGIAAAGPDSSPGYLMDFDYFTEEPLADLAAERIVARFDAFHDVLYAFFRWCVTPKALEEFRRASS